LKNKKVLLLVPFVKVVKVWQKSLYRLPVLACHLHILLCEGRVKVM
jgi:hypothetical protein